MRKDMPKVIVERPRRGSPKRARPGRAVPLEGEDGEVLRARKPPARKQKTKYLNENLAPLRRYLEAQVGRPWSKVYAEIAANLKPTSTVQQHVRDHVEDFVAVKCRMKDGKVLASRANRFGGEGPLDQEYRKLYVHPRTGLLRRNDKAVSWRKAEALRKAAIAAARAHRLRELAPGIQAHLLSDGAWWEVHLRRIGGGRPELYVDVVLRAKLSSLAPEELYGLERVYAAEKYQLSKADKKRLGLP